MRDRRYGAGGYVHSRGQRDELPDERDGRVGDSLPARVLPADVHTVTISGLNDLISASQSGTVTLAAPMRLNTTPAVAGRIATAGKITFRFVPEPGTMLLLLSGSVALLVIGRRRLRK